MPYDSRIELYDRIEAIRKRPLIAYVTSTRHNASGAMASDVIVEFIKQFNKIDKKHKKIDILIVSRGGDPIVPWRIISLLRERFDIIGVLLPYEAYSAATLLALGANEIIMHPNANLGPVDPQLNYKTKENESIQFGTEDLMNYLNFLKDEVGISDQEQMEKAFELICNDVGSIRIGVAKRSAHLALSLELRCNVKR